MIEINSFDEKMFAKDGITHYRKFFSDVRGDLIKVYNAFNPADVLIDYVDFSLIELNGVVYSSVAQLQTELLAVIYNASISTGDEFDQNNIFVPFLVNYSGEPTEIVLANVINSLPSFTIGEKQLGVFSAVNPSAPISTSKKVIFVITKVGKGNYGSGGTVLNEDNIQILSTSTPNIYDILPNPSTQIIDLGTLTTGTDVSQAVNALNPPVLVQDQEDGYVVFKAIVDGNEMNYLFLGEGGTYGLSALQTTIDDFLVLTGGDVEVVRVNWGNIDGILSDQTDLQNALNLKANDANVLHKTGNLNESFNGLKSSTNTGATQINGFSLTNSGTGSSHVLLVNSTGGARGGVFQANNGGIALAVENFSTGSSFFISNSSTGRGATFDNVSSGALTIMNSQTASTGDLLRFTKNGVTQSFFNQNGLFSATNSGTSQITGISLTNNGTTGSARAVNIENTSSGTGQRVGNTSTGIGTLVANSGTGAGSQVSNLAGGTGFIVDNQSTGIGFTMNSQTASTGDLLRFTKNNVTTLRVDSEGMIRGSNSGATSVIGIDLTNNGGVSTQVSSFTNTGAGRAILINNTSSTGGAGVVLSNGSNGNGIFVQNGATGTGYGSDNVGAGVLMILNSQTGSTGDLLQLKKNSSTITKFTSNGELLYAPQNALLYANIPLNGLAIGARGGGGNVMIGTRTSNTASTGFYQIAMQTADVVRTGEADFIFRTGFDTGLDTVGQLTASGAGFRFQNSSINLFTINRLGSLEIGITPTTSAGTYDFLTINTTTGVIEKVLSNSVASSANTININGDSKNLTASREWRTAQADTGVLTYGGITIASTTQINIGAVTGYVVNNETNPASPTYTFVNYAGETNKTVTTLGTGLASYVLLNSAGTIVFQNTYPTSAQRKANIFLGKVGHPTGTITIAGDEPDFITSPLSQFKDLFQALSFVNQGVYASPNGANLSLNISAGSIIGNGINFKNDRTNPNTLSVSAVTLTSLLRRTQTGAGGASTTTLDPANYDNGGVVTAIGGGGGRSTNQYIYLVPTQGIIVTYGQTIYNTLNEAISAVGKESIVVYPSLPRNAILLGVVSMTRTATSLQNTAQASVIFKADIFGQVIGSVAGTSTGTLQSAYNNSSVPQITVDDTLSAITIKNGRALDTSTVQEWKNIAGTTTASINGNGLITGSSAVISSVPTTSTAGAYDTLTRNTTTGAVEKIDLSTNFVTLSGAGQNITSNKSFNNSSSTSPVISANVSGTGTVAFTATSSNNGIAINAVNTATSRNGSLVYISNQGSFNTGSLITLSNNGGSNVADFIDGTDTAGAQMFKIDKAGTITGKKFSSPVGANASVGNATLVGGTVTVTSTAVTSNSIVMITRKTAGGTLGFLTYTVSANTLIINSVSALDTSTVSYFIMN